MKDSVRNDYMLVSVDPPYRQPKGIGYTDMYQLVLASRWKGQSLYPISSWPCHVFVYQPLCKISPDQTNLKQGDLAILAWADLYERFPEADSAYRSSLSEKQFNLTTPITNSRHMNKSEFRAFVERTLEDVIRFAELRTGTTLPRDIEFRWFSQKDTIHEGIVDAIVERVFVGEDQIYPCVDIGVGDLTDDGRPIITANIAGYSPRPFQKNWTGSDGPFVFIIGQRAAEKLEAGA